LVAVVLATFMDRETLLHLVVDPARPVHGTAACWSTRTCWLAAARPPRSA
jgi:hypothetical protein